LSLVGAPVIGSKVLSATPDGVNHLTSLRRAKLSFCDPHGPWQKGGVENLNGRARRFLPRESPPEALARPHLRRLADRLNDTPRRCLGYRTPREVFEHHLAAPTGPP
jgi:IS30 family transposase